MKSRIIIIDGDEHQRSSLVRFLVDRDFSVLGVGTYGQALEFIKRDVVDIIVTNFFIGKTSASVLCEFVHRNYADGISLIVYCDPPTTEIERKIRQYSPAFVFIKPLIPEDLLAVIQRITQSTRQQRTAWACEQSPV